MLEIDIAILETDKVICKNIEKFDITERGLLSQNVLAQLRNYVEYISQKIYSNGKSVDPNNYLEKKESWEFIKKNGKYRFLGKFHELLQKTVSHYTIDEGGAERLMLKYYEYLLRIKIFMKSEYNMEVLHNIDKFPLYLDTNLAKYYEKISFRINTPSNLSKNSNYNERSYIQKVKPFFVNKKIYYEITFTVANDRASKFDRVIAFTNLEIMDNYAVKLLLRDDFIEIDGQKLPIKIIENWEVSIRPCEMNNFGKIFQSNLGIDSGNKEFRNLMKFLTDKRISLTEIVTSSDTYYDWAENLCSKDTKKNEIFKTLGKTREIISLNKPGKNILRYLLYKMNNKVIKLQYNSSPCDQLSGLCLQWGCIPFETMPFATSPMKHNPRFCDLIECIDITDREHEFFSRIINNNTEKEDILFTPKKDITNFDNPDYLMQEFNSYLYMKNPKHRNRQICEYKNHYYVKGSANDTAEIIRKLKVLSSNGLKGYTSFVDSWLSQNESYKIDSIEKLNSLRNMFSFSKVALIYGPAGTGKSTLINHISNLYNDRNKLYLANTNPAVDNLRRKVNASNCEFMTISKFLLPNNIKTEYDILIIDECSTVSNNDMISILNKAKYNLIVLVGDVFQIEAIRFGNWFSIARSFVPKSSVFELTKPYRSTHKQLVRLWDNVRTINDVILEPMVMNKYSNELNNAIFKHSDKDEIILCLNYDGLYGINNLNRFLQSNNPSNEVYWGINTYKIGDPILFNESNKFYPLIYNNMKGKIVDIKQETDKIYFDIELDIAITEWESEDYAFTLVGESVQHKSVISFSVNKYKSSDEDDDTSDAVVPFQVAYAVSIHKAQGLEYKSVKIVLTNEVEELVTHDIFYTAITRAKEQLKIYWSPETEKKILDNLKIKKHSKDVALLTKLFELD